MGNTASHGPHQHSVAAWITASTKAHSSYMTDDASCPITSSKQLTTSSHRHGQHSSSSSSSTQCCNLHSRKYQGALIIQDRRFMLSVRNKSNNPRRHPAVPSDAIWPGVMLITVVVTSHVILSNSSLRLIDGAH